MWLLRQKSQIVRGIGAPSGFITVTSTTSSSKSLKNLFDLFCLGFPVRRCGSLGASPPLG